MGQNPRGERQSQRNSTYHAGASLPKLLTADGRQRRVFLVGKVEFEQFYARKFKNREGFWVERYPAAVSLYADMIRVRDAEILSELPADGRVLDLGCGAGDLMFKISERIPNVIGADIAPSNAALARKNLDGEARSSCGVLASSATALPFPDAFFDRVVMADVIEHVSNIPAALGEVRRVLKKGGRLICVTPDRDVQLLLVKLDDVLRGFRRRAHKMMVFERFLSPLVLRRHVLRSGLAVRAWRKICFYPGPEGGGLFARILKVIARSDVMREKLVEPTLRPLFRWIERAGVFNQKQMIVGERVHGPP
jgi:ubiquinone/menaquinone biosynthesis C-methylase UbiE